MRKIMMLFVIVFTLFGTTVFASAASDPAVVIISPVHKSEVNASSLLISVKVTQPKTIRVRIFEEKQKINNELRPILAADWKKADGKITPQTVEFIPAEDFVCTNALSFYTKQLNDVKAGTYRVQVDTINNLGKAVCTSYSLVIVSDKEDKESAKIFETSQSGTLQFLQNLLKSIFGDE